MSMIKIRVKMETGKVLILDCNKELPIADLKGMLAFKVSHGPDEQDLTFVGNKLEDGKTLKDYGINDNDIITLKIKSNNGCLRNYTNRSWRS